MSKTITIRVQEPLSTWIEETSAKTGISQGKLIRDHLERARAGDQTAKKFMRLAGSVQGARDLSKRKGFSKT